MSIEIINGKKVGFIGEDKIYIGRRNSCYELEASPLANIFGVRSNGRESSIEKYKIYLFQQVAKGTGPVYEELLRIARLHNNGEHIKLACWCYPKPCHGDVVKQVVTWLADNILEKNNDSNNCSNSK